MSNIKILSENNISREKMKIKKKENEFFKSLSINSGLLISIDEDFRFIRLN